MEKGRTLPFLSMGVMKRPNLCLLKRIRNINPENGVFPILVFWVIYEWLHYQIFLWLVIILFFGILGLTIYRRWLFVWRFTFPFFCSQKIWKKLSNISIEEAKQKVEKVLESRFLCRRRGSSPSGTEAERLEMLDPSISDFFKKYEKVVWKGAVRFLEWELESELLNSLRPDPPFWIGFSMESGLALLVWPKKKQIGIGRKRRAFREYPSLWHFLLLLTWYDNKEEPSLR